jgi:hypothetical protein
VGKTAGGYTAASIGPSFLEACSHPHTIHCYFSHKWGLGRLELRDRCMAFTTDVKLFFAIA